MIPERDSRNVELIAATPAHQPVLSNLLQLYIHDFSELIHVELGSDGRFVYPDLALYWSNPARLPFLARVDNHWAGFALVGQTQPSAGEDAIWDMAEFFVLRSYRRRAIGTHVAHTVFGRLPGPWQVRVMQANQAAVHFWRRAIEGYTGVAAETCHATLNGAPWHIFQFHSKG